MRSSLRVVITGVGLSPPIGIGKDAFRESLVAAEFSVDYVTAFGSSPYARQAVARVGANLYGTDLL